MFNFLKNVIMFYKPKKSPEIYNYTFAHRGIHNNHPENSLLAYENAIKLDMGIEVDVRQTMDGEIVCFHDRYMKRLLKIKGALKKYNYLNLSNKNLLNSKEKVTSLRNVLNFVNGKVPILIEVKGAFNKKFKYELINILKSYNGKYYFHVKNIIAYYRLKKIWKNKVFYIINPIRKRFNLIKPSSYSKYL